MINLSYELLICVYVNLLSDKSCLLMKRESKDRIEQWQAEDSLGSIGESHKCIWESGKCSWWRLIHYLSLFYIVYITIWLVSVETKNRESFVWLLKKEHAGFKIFGVQDRLSKKVEDFKQRLELIPRYNWDFDNYLEEDIPCAVRWHFLFILSL